MRITCVKIEQIENRFKQKARASMVIDGSLLIVASVMQGNHRLYVDFPEGVYPENHRARRQLEKPVLDAYYKATATDHGKIADVE